MGRTTYLPPITENNELNEYLAELHRVLFGFEEVDGVVDQANAPGFHDGDTGDHGSMVKADDAGNNPLSTLGIVSADADGTYGSEEATLINELKLKVNNLIAEFNVFVTRYNEQMQADRDAGQA